MKKFVLLIISIIALTLSSEKAAAQWTLFSDLFSQMNGPEFNLFPGDLGDLDSTWQVDQVYGNELLDEMYRQLDSPMPAGLFDSTFILGPGSGLDSLMAHLPGFQLPGADEDTLLGQTYHVQDIYLNNLDSLGGLFGQYQDSLSFDSVGWKVTIIGFDELSEKNLDILQDTFDLITGGMTPEGPGNLAGIIGQLFDAASFPDLELAFGFQSAEFKYWDDRYPVKANVIRLGSVPRFNVGSFDSYDGILRLPIEARWHVQASWVNSRIPTSFGDPGHTGGPDDRRFNPLLLSGDFAVMATPNLGSWGNTTFRLITSLGLEFGTYAPAHREYNPPFTSFNKGYATGFGPQVGGGFAMTTGSLTVYSIGTIAQGSVFHSPLPYRYNSQRFEVGMRFGNIVNVRYSRGNVSWQPSDNRLANVKHQFTVGIILQELHL